MILSCVKDATLHELVRDHIISPQDMVNCAVARAEIFVRNNGGHVEGCFQ